MNLVPLVTSALAALAALALAAPSAFADVVVPSSAFSNGQNNAEFHSDVRVFNPTNSPVLVTPVFYNQPAGGAAVPSVPSTFTIPARSQVQFDNVLASLFGLTAGVFGPIRFGTSAPIIVSSSVNNVHSCGASAVSGQWLPGIDQSEALKAGTLVQLAASADGASGYRSNVVFMNPGDQAANVTTSLRRGDGTLVATVTLDPLPANGFKQVGTLSAWLPSPNTITDTNLWLEFNSDQPVLSFASVINNASGDPFAIVMTAEPNVSASAPVASYTVSANPTPGQPVTFTDTSSNAPTVQLWSFGDGTTATSGASVAHTYGAAGTYKTAHFAGNAGGTGAAAMDVVVVIGTVAPITVTISANTFGGECWTFSCLDGPCSGPPSYCKATSNNNVNLRVGQPYVITWTTPASENKTHGIGGLAVLGIAQNDVITSNRPYVVNFTPTASMVGVHTYACTVTMCAPAQNVHDAMTGTLTIVP